MSIAPETRGTLRVFRRWTIVMASGLKLCTTRISSSCNAAFLFCGVPVTSAGVDKVAGQNGKRHDSQHRKRADGVLPVPAAGGSVGLQAGQALEGAGKRETHAPIEQECGGNHSVPCASAPEIG